MYVNGHAGILLSVGVNSVRGLVKLKIQLVKFWTG